jgi:preprotein translocase subunit SecA
VTESTSTTANPVAATSPRRPVSAPVVKQKAAYRPNDTVTIANLVSGEKKSVKFKMAEPLLQQGWIVLEG